jgi:putative membrane-bound dehydrogenase-like protein
MVALASNSANAPAMAQRQETSERIKTLFLGDTGHHQPAQRASELIPALAKAGIDTAYTFDLADLNPANLQRYDALIIYANHTKIEPDQEAALLAFVEGGKGLVVLHCGSYCFLNSPRYVALVGGQFKSHGAESFATILDAPDHPALKGQSAFEAFDETYVHDKLSDDRLVLAHRDDNGRPEPWIWVRNQGKGRVYYNASGHDERVFALPAFQATVAQGIRWAVGRPDFTHETKPFSRSPGELPDYKAGRGARLHDMQDPLDVAESMRHLSVPGGFRIELVAAEPEIVKPICMNWDERGRLFIAETVDYPNAKQPDGRGHDRIKICEDTDGDGRADKFTVFAEGLSIPTSLVRVPAGWIVTQAPDVLLLADIDDDDRADVRKVLFTGFSTNDTHAGPSNLRLGFDGWVYGTCGYAGFAGTVGGQPVRFGQSLFRFLPDGSKLEALTSTSNNTWGLGLTETNEIVYSTANGEHSSYLGLPNRAFESVRGWLGKGNARMADHDRMHPLTTIRQVDWFGGYTAAAGHAVYTARQFPPEFWNRAAFISEPTGHLVHWCQLAHDGSHLVSHDRFNLLASTEEWTSPIAAEVGPDGAVWVIDWYNYIVQHNPTPLGFETGSGNAYVTPLRDKTHGRIYRVVNNSQPLGQRFDLARPTNDQLIGALRSDNLFWRMTAQWQLVARGDRAAVPALADLAASPAVEPTTGENAAALHAVWTLAGLHACDSPEVRPVLVAALKAKAPGVRRAAAEVLPRSGDTAAALIDAGLLTDPDPVVRRAALLVLAECEPSVKVGAAIFTTLEARENALDRWIPLAATSAGARHDLGFLKAALAARDAPEAARNATRIVAEHFARGSAKSSLPALLASVETANTTTLAAVLSGLAAGWPEGNVPDLAASVQDRLLARMPQLDASSQLAVALLAQRWGFGAKVESALAELRSTLARDVADEGRPEADRIAAARRLARLDPDRTSLQATLSAISPKAAPTLSAGLLDAVGQSTTPDVAAVLIERWEQLTPALRKQSLEILLRRPEWTGTLVEALEHDTLAPTDLAIDQAQRLIGHPDKTLAERARTVIDRGGRLPSADRQQVLASLLPLCDQTGNAAQGRVVFEKNCAKCHKHGELGEQIGPNLTGFAVHPKEKILTEILDPNRSVEGNYRQYTVATSDGQVVSGLLASETKTAVELVDGEAKRHVVLRENIEEMIASPKSLMPEGFEKQITSAELTDLLEFLAAKGQYVPLPLDKAATILSTQGMFYDKRAPEQRLIFPDWSPKTAFGIPFQLVDPRGDRVPNVIMLYSESGTIPKEMPRSVTVPCNTAAKAIHLLSGVSGWGFPASAAGTTSMIVRLHYADGTTEDHPLKNGVHFADYIRPIDVPGSKLAFRLRGQQIRYLAIEPRKEIPIAAIEFVKGDDASAPIVMAVTAESR